MGRKSGIKTWKFFQVTTSLKIVVSWCRDSVQSFNCQKTNGVSGEKTESFKFDRLIEPITSLGKEGRAASDIGRSRPDWLLPPTIYISVNVIVAIADISSEMRERVNILSVHYYYTRTLGWSFQAASGSWPAVITGIINFWSRLFFWNHVPVKVCGVSI